MATLEDVFWNVKEMFLKEFNHLNEWRHAGKDMIRNNKVVCLSIGMTTMILGIFASCCNVSMLENI